MYLREQKDNCQAGHSVLFSPLKHEKGFVEQVQIREIERETINELRALERLVRPFCIILPIQYQAQTLVKIEHRIVFRKRTLEMLEYLHCYFGSQLCFVRLVLKSEVEKLETGTDQLRTSIVAMKLLARSEQRLQVVAFDGSIIDIICEFCELVETVVVEHQRLVHIFLLVEEEHAQALSEKLLASLL